MPTIPPLTSPTPKTVNIKGVNIKLLAFYFPDKPTSWDSHFNSFMFGNFYPCTINLTIPGHGGPHAFKTPEAAYQATKWWTNDPIRTLFEQAKSGDDAFRLIREYGHGAQGKVGLDPHTAMRLVLDEKFKDPAMHQALKDTQDAFMIEHNKKRRKKNGWEDAWSDNYDGDGLNGLGEMLMDIRQDLFGIAKPTPGLPLTDISEWLKNNFAH